MKWPCLSNSQNPGVDLRSGIAFGPRDENPAARAGHMREPKVCAAGKLLGSVHGAILTDAASEQTRRDAFILQPERQREAILQESYLRSSHDLAGGYAEGLTEIRYAFVREGQLNLAFIVRGGKPGDRGMRITRVKMRP